MSKSYNILYLDDEEQNLVSFQALFRRKYNVFTTTSAHEAVEILSKNEIHIIFSDQKMPEVSGVEFFETILPDFPYPVRVLLTGYADLEAVIDAINKGQVYRYVPKPWDTNDLEICVENALDKYRREQELLRKSKELDHFNNALEQFVFSTSQELRGPADSIIHAAKMLERSGGESDLRSAIETILTEANRIKEFGEQINQYYQNAEVEIAKEEVNLEALVNDVIRRAQHNPSVEHTIRTEFNLNGIFVSDKTRLRIILQNIINNAVQYADDSKESNQIAISVVQNDEKVVFRISDQGAGIQTDRLQQIYEIQVDPNSGWNAGIGMYLTKSVVDKMRGKINVISKPGQGTQITFELPNLR
jgi:two-component system sensor histidine kinase/response regulator